MARLTGVLVLLSVMHLHAQDKTQRGQLNLTEHVSGYTTFSYDSLRISDLPKLNGTQDLLKWSPTGYYRFNNTGAITETGTFSEEGTDVTKYRYDQQGRLIESVFYSNGFCYFVELAHYNSADKLSYRKRVTCKDELSSFFFIDYSGDQVVSIRTVDKDSVTVLAKETREVNEQRDEIVISSYEGDLLLNHAVVRKSTGQLLSETDFLLDSAIYYTYKYTYALDGKILEEQRISVINDEIDTTWFMHENWPPGYRIMEYHRNPDNKVVMTEIDYFDANDILLKTEYITKTRRVYNTIRHEFKYDQYGNWIYDITYRNSQPVSVVWRKLTYF